MQLNEPQAARICVVHLAWKPLGIERFARFVASYKENEAGTKHDLVVIFKAFENDDASLNDYYKLLSGVFYNSLFLPDEGFDIVPYFIAARNFNHKYF
jgi:hypothetical protein